MKNYMPGMFWMDERESLAEMSDNLDDVRVTIRFDFEIRVSP